MIQLIGRFRDPSKTDLNSPVGLVCPLAVSRRHPSHQLLPCIRPVLSLSVVCFDFRLLYKAGWFYIILCLHAILHGLYYASYGMVFVCVEGTMTSLVRECSLLDGSYFPFVI